MKPFGGGLRWALIFYTFLMSAMSYLDRVNLSIAGPTIQKEFGLTDVKLGLIASSFGWTASFLVPAALCVLVALPWLLVDPATRLANE